jgi:hypothetical protein
VGGTWEALSVHGLALLEVGARRVLVESNGRSASAIEVPFRLRVSASFPAHGPLGVMGGGSLRIPPTTGNGNDSEHLRASAVETELLAGLEVRL